MVNYDKQTLLWIKENANSASDESNPWKIFFDATESFLGTGVPNHGAVYRFLLEELDYPDVEEQVLTAHIDVKKLIDMGWYWDDRFEDESLHTFENAVHIGTTASMARKCAVPPISDVDFLVWRSLRYSEPSTMVQRWYHEDRERIGV